MTTLEAKKVGETSVRVADIRDLPYILSELPEYSDSFESNEPMYADEEYAKKFFSLLINEHILFIAEKVESNGDIVGCGFAAGLIGPNVYNPMLKTLTVMLWYVNPKFRTTRAGYRLIKEFIQWGKDNDCDRINAARQVGGPIKRETYERLGFRFQEQSFVMEINQNGSRDNRGSSRSS